MALPIRTTIADIQALCSYLRRKPTGASLTEARAVVEKKHLDGRKLSAFRFWRIIEDDGSKLKLTDRGRRVADDASRCGALGEVVHEVAPYMAVMERADTRKEQTISALDVATHWHEHFKDEVAGTDKILNDQALCFFQLAEGADLGKIVIGRKGMPTRFGFDMDAVREFCDGLSVDDRREPPDSAEDDDDEGEMFEEGENGRQKPMISAENSSRVFVTHGKNMKIRDQVKVIIEFGQREPVVAMEHETSAKPVPQKVMDDMRSCGSAVIHVSAEGLLYDDAGTAFPQINANVLIEIGAAMALYRDRFVLLVEEGVDLPSNLQGLYECRYSGDELNLEATMKLLKSLSEF